MTAVFSAASWLPQKRKFFRDKAMGRIIFSPRLSKRFDNLGYPNFNIIQTFLTNNFKTAV
jgi:hypothetical protein